MKIYVSKETVLQKLTVLKSLPRTFDRIRRIQFIESFLQFGKKLKIYNYEFIRVRYSRQKNILLGCKLHSAK